MLAILSNLVMQYLNRYNYDNSCEVTLDLHETDLKYSPSSCWDYHWGVYLLGVDPPKMIIW